MMKGNCRLWCKSHRASSAKTIFLSALCVVPLADTCSGEVIKAKLSRDRHSDGASSPSMSDHRATTPVWIGSPLPARVLLTTFHDLRTWRRRREEPIRSVRRNVESKDRMMKCSGGGFWVARTWNRFVWVVDLADIATAILKRSACSAASYSMHRDFDIDLCAAWPTEALALRWFAIDQRCRKCKFTPLDLRALASRDANRWEAASLLPLFTHSVTIRVHLSPVTIRSKTSAHSRNNIESGLELDAALENKATQRAENSFEMARQPLQGERSEMNVCSSISTFVPMKPCNAWATLRRYRSGKAGVMQCERGEMERRQIRMAKLSETVDAWSNPEVVISARHEIKLISLIYSFLAVAVACADKEHFTGISWVRTVKLHFKTKVD